MTEITLRLLSLGAGVQSTVIALMAAKGELGPMPDGCIFSDTGWEPKGVYDHLDWLEGEIKRLTNDRMKVYRVSKGDIRDEIIEKHAIGNKKNPVVPFFSKKGGMARRQCTRQLLGMKKGQVVPKTMHVETWIGISTDEIVRMKESRNHYITHRFPLIEENMNRRDCIAWFAKNYPGRALAKSACIGCPFHDDASWREMKKNDPVSWADAVEVDKLLRADPDNPYMEYMHRSCVPLDEVDLRTAADMGQIEFGFDDECEGMCGV